MKTNLNITGWLRDSGKTLLILPFHILLGIYAAFLQCGSQLYYDFKNNSYETDKL